MAKKISIAIDGPAGAGKSTIARRLAAELGYHYVDTGAIYRTVAYFFDLWGVSPKDIDGITRYIDELTIRIEYDAEGVQHMIMNGMDVTKDIRTQEISQKASIISAHAICPNKTGYRNFIKSSARSVNINKVAFSGVVDCPACRTVSRNIAVFVDCTVIVR